MLLIQRLHQLLVSRAVKSGTQLISENKNLLMAVEPGDPGTPFCFYIAAAWLKYSEDAIEIVRRLHSAYEVRRPELPKDRGWIFGARALLALHEYRHSDAKAICRRIRENAELVGVGP
jgi:hypothetical protein